jgi:UDP-N-acetylglucosamine 2-epimerase
MNRQVTGRIAEYDFAPTPLSRQNLLDENVPEEKISVTGNTVIDALHWVVGKIEKDRHLSEVLVDNLMKAGYDTGRIEIPGRAGDDGKRRLVLITGHRRENFGEGFISMCTAIRDLARKYPEVDFVYPMHLNPNVRKPIKQVFGEMADQVGDDGKKNLFFIEPLDYLDFVYLMSRSYIVLTDSGGIQEEAPGLGKPVLVMRDTTERPEALDAGTVRLVGTDYDRIMNEVSALLDDRNHYETMSHAVNPYGDGKACPRIVDKLK